MCTLWQARIVTTEEALRRDRDPPEEARGDPDPVPSGPWSWIIFKRVLSGLGLLDTSLTPNSTFVVSFQVAIKLPHSFKNASVVFNVVWMYTMSVVL